MMRTITQHRIQSSCILRRSTQEHVATRSDLLNVNVSEYCQRMKTILYIHVYHGDNVLFRQGCVYIYVYVCVCVCGGVFSLTAYTQINRIWMSLLNLQYLM